MNHGTNALRTILVVFSSNSFTIVLSLLRVLVLPAKLGDSGMGVITLAISFTTFFGIFTSLGVSTYLVRAVAREPASISRYLSNALVLRMVMSVVVFGLLMEIAIGLGYSHQTLVVIFIIGTSMVISTLSNVFESCLQGLGQQNWRVTAITVGQAIATAVGIMMLIAGADATTYALSIPLGVAVELVIATAFFFLRHPIQFNIDWVIIRDLLISSMPLFLWGLLQSAYLQIDATLLSLFATDRVIGWFGTALQISNILIMVPTAICAVAMPILCELHLKDRARFDKVANKITISTLMLMVPVCLGLAVSSGDLLRLLPYPATFLNAAPVLSLLALGKPVTGVLMVLATLAIAMGQERQWMKISIFAVCIFPPLYVCLIWLFQAGMANGAIGAALANFIGEGLLLVWAWAVLPRSLHQKGVLYRGAQIVALSTVMTLVVVLFQKFHAPLVVYAPVGGLVYLSGVWLLRLFTPDDLRLVRASISGRKQSAEALS